MADEQPDGPDREQALSALRQVRQFIEQTASKHDVPELARQLGEALSLTAADLAAAARDLGLSGTAASTSSASGSFGAPHITGSGGVTMHKMRILAFGEVGTGTDTLSVVKTEVVGELTEQATRTGIAGLSWSQLFIVVLALILMIGLFVIIPELSSRGLSEVQANGVAVDFAMGVVHG